MSRTAETAQTEGWAFLTPSGVGAHYFRDGKSFCGRPLPAGVVVRGDVFGAGSDPEECRRCAKRAHDEADALAADDDDEPCPACDHDHPEADCDCGCEYDNSFCGRCGWLDCECPDPVTPPGETS